jgi:hypothetical protein
MFGLGKIFNKWLFHKMHEAREYYNSMEVAPRYNYDSCSTSSVKFHPSGNKGMDFTIHKAPGGWVVTHTWHDRRLGEDDSSIHIIHENDSLGDGLEKIIMAELLKK